MLPTVTQTNRTLMQSSNALRAPRCDGRGNVSICSEPNRARRVFAVCVRKFGRGAGDRKESAGTASHSALSHVQRSLRCSSRRSRRSGAGAGRSAKHFSFDSAFLCPQDEFQRKNAISKQSFEVSLRYVAYICSLILACSYRHETPSHFLCL